MMSMIITSDLASSYVVRVFHDETLTTAILDRVTHQALIQNIYGKSFLKEPKRTIL